MNIQFLFISLIAILMSNLTLGQDCNSFGERISLGDFYTSKDDNKHILTIAVNTQDLCEGVQLKIIQTDQNNDNKQTIQYLENFLTKHIDGGKYTNNEFQYSIYSYFFQLGSDQNINEGDKNVSYQLIQKDSDDQIIEASNSNPTFDIKMIPYKNFKNDQIDSILIYGDYDANVQELSQGDIYGQVSHEYLLKTVEENNEEFNHLLFMGDFAYDLNSESYMRSQKFFEKAKPYYATNPQTITYGNHESGNEQENYDYKFVNDYFYMPDYQKGKNRNFEFDTMYAQLINFDAKYLWYKEDQENIDRVTQNLEYQLIEANHRRAQRPWIIVYTHYPIYYADEEDNFDKKKELFEKIEVILNKYKVDLYISGHVHCYQRYLPIKNGELQKWEQIEGLEKNNGFKDPNAPIYIVEGIAGQEHQTSTVPYLERDLMAFQDYGEAGMGYLKIYNETHLYYEHFLSADGQVIDSFWIAKHNSYRDSLDFVLVIVLGSLNILCVIAYAIYYQLNKKKHIDTDLLERQKFLSKSIALSSREYDPQSLNGSVLPR